MELIEKKARIIAECGKNQTNKESGLSVADCLENAKRLALAAKESGADICKWQAHVFRDERLKRSHKRYEWIKRNEELTPLEDFWIPLKQYHEDIRVGFLVTPMSTAAAKKVNSLVSEWKVGSADILDFELLDYLVSTRKRIIISSGMSTMKQLQSAVVHLVKQSSRFSIMHCVSEYPTPEENINLDTIRYLKDRYPSIPIGFSDHTLSTDIPSYAVAMGATIIEKHFTLDREAFGPDHKASLLPSEFREMVEKIRRVEVILGQYNKLLTEKEMRHWENFRI